MSTKNTDMLAAMREAMLKGMLPQIATLDDEVVAELAKLLADVSDACERELRQRKLAAAEPSGRA